MIIGNGLISKSLEVLFKQDEDVIIFASGVSNSQETNETNFLREQKLLEEILNSFIDKKIVYFSSILLKKNISSPYYNHKRKMEKLIKKKSKNFLIIRLPQVIGFGGNNKNLINYFINKINSSEIIEIEKKTYRSIIDVSDLKKIIVHSITTNKKIVNIYGFERIEVLKLAILVSELTNKPINILLKKRGKSIKKEKFNLTKKIAKEIDIDIKNYTKKTLKKYLSD